MGSGSQCDGTGREVRGTSVLVIASALLSTLTSMAGAGQAGQEGWGQGKEERSSSVSLRW